MAGILTYVRAYARGPGEKFALSPFRIRKYLTKENIMTETAKKYKSLYPPICLQGPMSKRWYVIAGGVWHRVKRKYDWKELESMWERIEYSQPKVVVSAKKQYIVDGSKGNKYTVTEDKGFWSCTCPAHGFGRGKDCKHITQIKNK